MPSLLDDLVKGQQELESLKSQKEALHQQISLLQVQVKTLTTESEQASRVILQQARDDAKLILKQAEDQNVTATQKLQEVLGREQAVEYVKEKAAALEARADQLAAFQAEAQKVLSDATAQQELYVNKVKELKSYEDALVKREQEGDFKEREVGIAAPVVPESEVKSKKKAKETS